MTSVETDRNGDGGTLDAAPGLARIAAAAWIRTAGWAASTSLRASRRVARTALGQEPVSELIGDARDELVGGARRLLGASGLDTHLQTDTGRDSDDRQERSLRDRGAALLERSSELTDDGDGHPAYARILTELSPDEARILRLLATDGPQPAVDVRAWRPLDVGSSAVAPGLSMVGVHAGVMRPERVPVYLSNLYRLGLIWFSRETLSDPTPYQVLEAQPDVIEAVREAGRARIVRRSIDLTPFGGHFCRLALPLDTAEIEALPTDGVPA